MLIVSFLAFFAVALDGADEKKPAAKAPAKAE
jgi:hypothetical protein